MLKAGQNYLINSDYQPSRFQGSLIPELIISATSLIGGHYLSNLISVILGVGTLYIFHLLLSKMFKKKETTLIILIVGFNPYFVIASSTSIDYIYSLFFIFLGSLLLFKNFRIIAAISFALALSSRLSNAMLVGLVYLYFILPTVKTDKNKFFILFLSGLFSLILTLALYIPAYTSAGNTLSFLSYAIGDWSASQYVARFIYKNIALFGMITSIFIYLSFFYYITTQKIHTDHSKLFYFAVCAFIIEEALFLKIPLEISYLLPAVFLLLPLYIHVTKSSFFGYILLFLSIFYNFINIDFLKMEYTMENPKATDMKEATGAKIGLFIKQGAVYNDIKTRKASQDEYFNTNHLPIMKVN
ncbi:hypothetical protein [Granulosicoccus antarcticus]|nr:hypothetical protein [Granulosicoccus antarcticus]